MNKENESVRSLAKRAAQAALELAHVSHAARNEALVHIRDQLLAEEKRIIAANQRDLQRAEKEALATPLLKRLRFQEREIANVCKGIEATSALPDPLGRVIDKMALDEGLILQRITVPIGTIGVVFESRPDALVQIAALSLKSGNCTLMKGGREAEETNMLLAEIISAACRDSEIPDGWLTLLTTRSEVRALLTCSDEVDLIIPRGSNAFVKSIMAESSIPVLGHADGVCHLYIDRHADSQMARAIAIDAKTQYPAVCNAAECLLIHADTAPTLLPHLVADLSARGVTLYGCPRTQEIASAVMEATPEHWGREYLALEMAVKVVA